ncbi:acyltransferase domain-containing protein [Nocardia suismassiliense]|uniref:Acyltransferase domain-containing protein n=1 Tax=Nocardia suismassiliense TaxID=2077092 RepID=A0ABW6QQ97_9NOCA
MSAFLSRPPRRSARPRLFCFPHSGGGASVFRGWQQELPGWVDVLPVLLPGREERASEPPLADLDALADAVVDALRPHLDAPFALFGHSLGGLLAYQVALRLHGDGAPAPVALLVAGLAAPHRLTPDPMHELPDDELLDRIFEMGGTPAELRDERDLLRAALPALRADVTMFSTYQHRPAAPVECPIVVFSGRDDTMAAPDDADAWGELTDGTVRTRVLPGGHFFVRTHRRELTRMVTAELRRFVPPVDRPWSAAVPEPARHGRIEPVAVVGIGCRLPGADDPQALWRLLVDGVDAVTEVPDRRTEHPTVFGRLPAVPSGFRRFGGFLDDVAGFDAAFFGISPREADRMDPQQRLLLEVAWEALEDAGIPPTALAGTRTGVFVGQMGRDYWELQARQSSLDLHALTGGGLSSFLSGRISFALDLRGPSVSVDTACSSSLTAVHLAWQSLQLGDSDLALAAGVNLVLLPELAAIYEQVGLMSRRGRCRFGDATGDGFVRSEGVGVVVLKPLAQARADGDRVYAVIAGSASNNDGSGGGSLVAPAQEAQERLLRDALDRAGIDPAAVDYVEAHGTGTNTGDAIELRALSRVFAGTRPAGRPCLVGSVKTNIGHPEGAAGISGFIKTVLSLHHRLIPANPLLTEPHPVLLEPDTPLRMPTEPVAWPQDSAPVAGVTSFGLSGTNVHVVLTAPLVDSTPDDDDEPQPLVLPLSARDRAAAQALTAAYADRLDGADPVTARRVCAVAARGRTHHEWRSSVAALDGDGLAEALRAQLPDEVTQPPTDGVRVAFVFPGHGSQWVGMGRELLNTSAAFRTAIENCDAAIQSAAGWSLLKVLADDDGAELAKTAVIQPAVWAMQVALAQHWRSWGIGPDVVIGHSFGEVAAATVAGAIDLPTAAELICRRGELTSQADGLGGMVAVAMPADEAEAAAARYGERLVVAARNSPRLTVLSGESDALDGLLAELRDTGVRAGRVRINFASHSRFMDPLQPQLITALAGLRAEPVTVPLRSTVTGERMSGPDLDAQYWADNLRSIVRFADAIAAENALGPTVFLEISPHSVLVQAMEQCLADSASGTAVAGLRRDTSETARLAEIVARLYTAGVDPDWSAIYPTFSIPDEMPTYPWQRRRTWFTPAESVADIPVYSPPAPPAPEVPAGGGLLDTLTAELGAVLGLPAQRIPRRRPLRDVGCDSLAAVEIRARLEQRWGTEISSSAVLAASVEDLAEAITVDHPDTGGRREMEG